MPIETSSGSAGPLRPGKVTRSQILKMVEAFRKNPTGGDDGKGNKRELTKFAHFGLPQVIAFLIDNGLAMPGDSIESLLQDISHGVKIYFSQHVDKDDCPLDYENYVGRNTVVLVGTVFNTDTGKWDDILKDDTGPQLLTADPLDTDDAGSGEDKATLCPPQCPDFGETL